ncbi:MAG TPA: CAP domain-containing protein [Burkholderiaceae bacterium]
MDSLIVAGSPAGHAARRRVLATLFRAVAGAALASALHGCGGGGSGAPEPPPPAPTPAPSPAPSGPIAAQMTVPTPVGYDAERLAAFNRLNEIRLSAGLGMVAQSTAMDQAAQAHADWMVANDVFSHEEQTGTPGFVATDWPLRDEAFGYVPVGGGEVMSAPAHGAAGVDGLINTVYHRAVMLAFEPVDVGIGWSGAAGAHVSMPLVIDMTRPGSDSVRGLGQTTQPTIGGIAVWPLDHASGVPLQLGLENPNPVPSRDVLSLGTPMSVTIDRLKTISTMSFVLSESGTGTVIPTRLISNQTDPNFLVPPSFVAAVPLVVLNPNTTYNATFSGITTSLEGTLTNVNRTWSFTTAAH